MVKKVKDLIILTGPTAVGKTNISIRLAKQLDGEIVSADSMQIYKGMDVGSAKISKEEMQGIPHHMIDIVAPDESFSVSDFKERAEEAIEDIISRGKMPIVVGGTGLYINSLIYNYDFACTDKDLQYREHLQSLAELHGKEYVHSMLKEVDSASYERLYPNDLKRVIRALEVFKVTGKTLNEYNQENQAVLYDIPYNVHYFVINMNREELYRRIDQRVDIMLDYGLVDEVIKLKEKGYTSNMQSMKGIGYKEILDYLDGKMSYDEAVYLIKKGSRNYAKRQLTWFRKEERAFWLSKEDFEDENDIIDKILFITANK